MHKLKNKMINFLLFYLNFLIYSSTSYRKDVPSSLPSSISSKIESRIPLKPNVYQLLFNLTRNYREQTKFELFYPKEFEYSIFQEGKIVYYLPEIRFSMEVLKFPGGEKLNCTLNFKDDKLIAIVVLENIERANTEYLNFVILDQQGIDKGFLSPFKLFCYYLDDKYGKILLHANTNFHNIIMSNGTRDLMTLNFSNDPLNFENYKNAGNERGKKYFDLIFTIEYPVNKKLLLLDGIAYNYSVNAKDLQLFLYFENFYCDIDNSTLLNAGFDPKNVSIENASIFQNEEKKQIVIEIGKYFEQKTFFFNNIKINITNLILYIDHKVNSNQKYFYDDDNKEDEYDFYKSTVTAILKYQSNNSTIEKLSYSIDKKNLKLISLINSFDQITNIQNIEMNIYKTFLYDTFNSFEISANILLTRNWNVFTIKFELRYNQNYNDYLLMDIDRQETKNKFIEVDSDFFKPINSFPEEKINSFCKNVNVNNELLSYKLIMCYANIYNEDLDQKVFTDFYSEQYICIFCQYQKDQQIHLILNNKFSEDFNFNKSSIYLQLQIHGLSFNPYPSMEQYINYLQIGFLTSMVYMKENIVKVRDYDFLLKKVDLNKTKPYKQLKTITFDLNQSCFYPKNKCNYVLGILSEKNSLNLFDNIVIYFSENFPIDDFELISSNITDFSVMKEIFFRKITLVPAKKYALFGNFYYTIQFKNNNPAFSEKIILSLVVIMGNEFEPFVYQVDLSERKVLYELTETNYKTLVSDANQITDYEIEFNYIVEYPSTNLIIFFDGNFDIAYYSDQLERINVELYKNEKRIPSKLFFCVLKYNYFVTLTINATDEAKFTFSKGSYMIKIVNAKNPLRHSSMHVNISFFDNKEQISFQKIFLNSKIFTNFNMNYQKSTVTLKNEPDAYFSQYYFSITIKKEDFKTNILKLYFPLSDIFWVYRVDFSPRTIDLEINFPNNPKIKNFWMKVHSEFGRFQLKLPFFEELSDVEIVEIIVLLYKLDSNGQKYIFSLYFIDLEGRKVNQLIDNECASKEEISFEAIVSNNKSIENSNYILRWIFGSSYNVQYVQICIIFPSSFTNINLQNTKILVYYLNVFYQEISKPNLVDNKLIIVIENNFYLDIANLAIMMTNVLNPFFQDKFCLKYYFLDKKGRQITKEYEYCPSISGISQDEIKFECTLENMETNLELLTIYYLTCKGNYLSSLDVGIEIDFPSSNFLSFYEKQVECAAESESYDISDYFFCQKIDESKLLIKNLFDESIFTQTRSNQTIKITIFNIKNTNTILPIYITLFSGTINLIKINKTILSANDNPLSISSETIVVFPNNAELILPIPFPLWTSPIYLSNVTFLDLIIELKTPFFQLFLPNLSVTCFLSNKTLRIPFECIFSPETHRILIKKIGIIYFNQKFNLTLENTIIPEEKLKSGSFIQLSFYNQSKLIFLKKFLYPSQTLYAIKYIDILTIYHTLNENYPKDKKKYNLTIIFALPDIWCSECQERIITYPPSSFVLKGVGIGVEGKYRNFVGKNYLVLECQVDGGKEWGVGVVDSEERVVMKSEVVEYDVEE